MKILVVVSLVVFGIIALIQFLVIIYRKGLDFLGVDRIDLSEWEDQQERVEELIASKIRERIGLSLLRTSRLFRTLIILDPSPPKTKRDRKLYRRTLFPALIFEKMGKDILTGNRVKFHYDVSRAEIAENLGPEKQKELKELRDALWELKKLTWINRFLFFSIDSDLDIRVNMNLTVKPGKMRNQ